ncbi:MAG: hypothetical protein N2657_06060 [bacterium]|nr:hypothetical protein [bacterium]
MKDSKIEKKVNHITEIKLIPLNTTTNLDSIIDNNDVLILNYSSPNIRMIFKFIEYFFLNHKNEIDTSRFSIVCIIPHKIKYHEEYLVHNLPFPIYQTTDSFSMPISKDIVLTNRNNNLEIFNTFSSVAYELAYLFIKKDNNIKFSVQNEISLASSNVLLDKYKYINIPLNSSQLVKDIRVKPFRKGYIISGLRNISGYSTISIYFFINYNLEELKSIKINELIKSLDLLPLDHNNILIFLLTIDNKLILQKYVFDRNMIQILDEFDLATVHEKLKDLDLKKIRINNQNIILWDHNTIYILRYNITKELVENERLEIYFYNVSGQKSRHTPIPTDGIWKQTIWGNINNIHLEDNFIYVADTEYSLIRTLDIETGKSFSLSFKPTDKEYEKLKGKISDCFYTVERTFFIDLNFKKIRYVDNTKNIAKTVFYDENINLFSQLFFLDSLNATVYSTFDNLIFIDLYRMDIRKEKL